MALNLVLLIVVIFIITDLNSLKSKVDTLALSIIPSDKKAIPPFVQETVQKTTVDSRSIKITNAGFLPAGFQIYANKETTIQLENNTDSPHSFIIDELNINSGLIESGTIKDIVINSGIAQIKNYTFYSNTEGDDPQTFKGVLMVLE